MYLVTITLPHRRSCQPSCLYLPVESVRDTIHINKSENACKEIAIENEGFVE